MLYPIIGCVVTVLVGVVVSLVTSALSPGMSWYDLWWHCDLWGQQRRSRT